MHPLLLAFAAAAVLAILALRSWPADLARHDRIHVELRHLREAEWALALGEPYRGEGLQTLARITDELGELARGGGLDDPVSFTAEVRSYHECVTQLSLSAGPDARDLWDVHQRGARLAEAFDASMAQAIESASRWRLGLLAFSGLLMAHLAWNLRREARTARALHASKQELELRVHERTAELESRNLELAGALKQGERARDEARQAQAAAEESSRLKSGFLANMSHEIRTPMTAILGFAEQLLDPALDDEQRVESIGMIRRNGDHLMRLIDDVLDISKIEAGHLEIHDAPCNLLALLAEVRAVMATRAARKGLEFRIDLPQPVPEQIVTDALRLKQVLLNLVGNAIKFTEHGFVRLTLGCRDARAGTARLWFRVEDTGIGMSSETLGRLFRPFTQADSSTTRRFGGTGLGLSISRHLAERLGGGIVAESQVGRGSSFVLEIRAGLEAGSRWRGAEMLEGASVRLSDTRIVPREPALNARILLAEDGEDNRRLIAHLVRRTGAHLATVENGAEAVELVLRERDAGQPFDLILMDMQMPVLDGLAAVRRLREAGVRTPVIALTANAMSADRERCLVAGCDEFCAKPIDFGQFFDLLQRYSRGAQPAQPVPAGPAARATGEAARLRDPSLAALVERFVAELGDDVGALRAALLAGDRRELERRAHQLKGCCGSYGFPELGHRAAALEQAAARGSDDTTLEAAFAAFAEACSATSA